MSTEAARRLPRLVAVCAALVLAAFAVSSYSFWNGHRNACKSRNVSLDVLHDILSFTAPTVKERESIPTAQLARADAFYTRSYERIDKARCR